MRLDLAIGQTVRYKGKEGQVIDVDLLGNDVCILFRNGDSLWVEQERLVDENPSIPDLDEDWGYEGYEDYDV